MPSARALRAAILLVVFAVPAAGWPGVARQTAPPGNGRPPATRAASTSPEARPSDEGLPRGMPLVPVVHPTRPPLDLAPGVLSGLVGGRVADWKSLGETPGDIRLVLGPDAAAAALPFWLLAGVPAAVALRTDEAAASAASADPAVLAIVRGDAAGPGVRTLALGGADPLLDPQAYPLRVPGLPPGSVVTATAVGDILLTRTVHTRMVAAGDWTAPFRSSAARLKSADLTFGNFESTVSRAGVPRPGGTSFVSVPQSLRGLTAAGFDLVSLANNHTGDFGARALVETVDLIEATGIATVGAGADEARARRPAILERKGVRFGFLAFNAIIGTPAAGPGAPGAVRIRMAPWFPFSQPDFDAMVADVRALRPKVDVLIVYPHWGAEYTNRPNDDQRRVGRALVDAGADLVIATHPHWVQGAEIHNGRLIAHSLGNFVFDQTWSRETEEGAALELVFWGSRLVRAEFVPVRIEDAHRPRFLDSREGRPILERIWRGSGEPFGRSP